MSFRPRSFDKDKVAYLCLKYLPSLPLDSFGDGKQTVGYVLLKAALPDGGDRPLVYTREDHLSDGAAGAVKELHYRIDAPQYGSYQDDGSRWPRNEQQPGGQFRDVTRWVPTQSNDRDAPTTRPL